MLLGLVTFLVALVGQSSGRPEGPAVVVVLGFVILILSVAWLAWYIVVLFQCRGARGLGRGT